MRVGLLACIWMYICIHNMRQCMCHVVEMTGWWLQPFSVCAGSSQSVQHSAAAELRQVRPQLELHV